MQDRKEYNKQYYKENKENVLKQKREYYANNKKNIAKYNKQYRADNDEELKKAKKQYNATHKKETKNRNLKRCYDVTIEQHEEMFNVQEGKCKICGKHQSEFKQPLGIDHNHTTGKIRSLLCSNCNTLLGYAKDDINILQKAINYLSEYV